ncbi:hypothetical protein VaNZ11_015409, partial [Volvox africanus]
MASDEDLSSIDPSRLTASHPRALIAPGTQGLTLHLDGGVAAMAGGHHGTLVPSLGLQNSHVSSYSAAVGPGAAVTQQPLVLQLQPPPAHTGVGSDGTIPSPSVLMQQMLHLQQQQQQQQRRQQQQQYSGSVVPGGVCSAVQQPQMLLMSSQSQQQPTLLGVTASAQQFQPPAAATVGGSGCSGVRGGAVAAVPSATLPPVATSSAASASGGGLPGGTEEEDDASTRSLLLTALQLTSSLTPQQQGPAAEQLRKLPVFFDPLELLAAGQGGPVEGSSTAAMHHADILQKSIRSLRDAQLAQNLSALAAMPADQLKELLRTQNVDVREVIAKLNAHIDLEKAKLEFGGNYWYGSRKSYNRFVRGCAEAAIRENQVSLRQKQQQIHPAATAVVHLGGARATDVDMADADGDSRAAELYGKTTLSLGQPASAAPHGASDAADANGPAAVALANGCPAPASDVAANGPAAPAPAAATSTTAAAAAVMLLQQQLRAAGFDPATAAALAARAAAASTAGPAAGSAAVQALLSQGTQLLAGAGATAATTAAALAAAAAAGYPLATGAMFPD